MSQDFGATKPRWTGTSALIVGYTLEGLETARHLALDGVTVHLVGAAPNPDEALPVVCDLPLAHGLVAPDPSGDLTDEATTWYSQTRAAVDQNLPAGIAIEATATLHHRRSPGWRPAWTEHIPTVDVPTTLPDWPYAFAFPAHVVDPPRLAAYLAELATASGAVIHDQGITDLDAIRELCAAKTYDIVIDTLGLTGPSTFEDPRAQWAAKYIDRYPNTEDSDHPGDHRATLIDGNIFSVIPGPRYIHVSSSVAEIAGIDDLDDLDTTCTEIGEDALQEARNLRPDLAHQLTPHNQARYLWTRSFNPFGPRITLDPSSDNLPPVLHLWYLGENSTALFAGAANALSRYANQVLTRASLD